MNISKLNEEAVREILQTIVDKLDELDEEDFFGTEGWKHFRILRYLLSTVEVLYFGAGGAKMNDEKKISVPIPSNADREFEEDGNQWGAQE